MSEELRVIRARLPKETVRALADRCGVPYSTLHKALNGDRMIDVEELHKIAAALGTTGSSVLLSVEDRLAADQAEPVDPAGPDGDSGIKSLPTLASARAKKAQPAKPAARAARKDSGKPKMGDE